MEGYEIPAWSEGNSVIARHEEQERLEAIRECDEIGQSAECLACGERTLADAYTCKAVKDSPVTAYCIAKGQRGCLYKLTGRCQGYETVSVCTRCGEKN